MQSNPSLPVLTEGHTIYSMSVVSLLTCLIHVEQVDSKSVLSVLFERPA